MTVSDVSKVSFQTEAPIDRECFASVDTRKAVNSAMITQIDQMVEQAFSRLMIHVGSQSKVVTCNWEEGVPFCSETSPLFLDESVPIPVPQHMPRLVLNPENTSKKEPSSS